MRARLDEGELSTWVQHHDIRVGNLVVASCESGDELRRAGALKPHGGIDPAVVAGNDGFRLEQMGEESREAHTQVGVIDRDQQSSLLKSMTFGARPLLDGRRKEVISGGHSFG